MYLSEPPCIPAACHRDAGLGGGDFAELPARPGVVLGVLDVDRRTPNRHLSVGILCHSCLERRCLICPSDPSELQFFSPLKPFA